MFHREFEWDLADLFPQKSKVEETGSTVHESLARLSR